ncbi:septum formation initiator family protein [Anaerocolumna sp. AGMB13020]|uniref:FtsB family cell division protein n=1 Tax=Anaerocolumna sp. AGMB13020 TaxID=3081750 RepID=UPI0029536401|nr:septum formation initiator family protein [Anaerocolumna sp. AGMB13020]WOO34777.1 septum formation initiator family protein [Anaerocolumna sp. AGMB13020]
MKGRNHRRKKRRTGLFLTAVMVLSICAIVTYKQQSLDLAEAKADEKIEQLNKQIEDEQQRAEDIEEKKAYVKTKKFIEEMAREKFNLVYKDEIIFKSEE